ncbi:MAG: 2,3-bisphosphoglycerate-independent phosphoglycerate mutase, partial [Limisphaerales bacterium]
MSLVNKEKCMLIVMDGWGMGPDPAVSAIAQASTDYVDSLYTNYPHSELRTDGEFVGLPTGQMGNSEVGHLNIGAGRIVYQELLRIHNSVKDGEFAKNKTLQAAIQTAKTRGSRLHFMGLLSDGGVHSHIDHLKALCSLANSQGIVDFAVHAFLDGRDTDPQGGAKYLQDLLPHLAQTGGKLASVIGRYYAMDRDQRWERTFKAYDLLVHGNGKSTTDPIASVKEAYSNDITDEFMEALSITDESGNSGACISENDVLICFNFRTDRCRQITRVLTQEEFPDHNMSTVPLHYVTMTKYDAKFKNVHVVFEKDNLIMTLGETLAKAGKSQIRIAETEKYPHVTFFFSGGREIPFDGETRLMANSPKVATYDLQPEMSAFELRDKIIPELEKGDVDFVMLNFANADMVGHTGVMEAAIKACETVDKCVEAVCTAAVNAGYSVLLTADHGNADKMKNKDGSPNTAH